MDNLICAHLGSGGSIPIDVVAMALVVTWWGLEEPVRAAP